MPTAILGCCLSLVLLAACNGPLHVEPWVGHHRTELLQLWGPPTKEFRVQDKGLRQGYASLVYEQDPGAYQLQYGTLSSTCHMTFHVDPDGLITSSTYELC